MRIAVYQQYVEGRETVLLMGMGFVEFGCDGLILGHQAQVACVRIWFRFDVYKLKGSALSWCRFKLLPSHWTRTA
jgi:hypothetical protein